MRTNEWMYGVASSRCEKQIKRYAIKVKKNEQQQIIESRETDEATARDERQRQSENENEQKKKKITWQHRNQASGNINSTNMQNIAANVSMNYYGHICTGASSTHTRVYVLYLNTPMYIRNKWHFVLQLKCMNETPYENNTQKNTNFILAYQHIYYYYWLRDALSNVNEER